MEKLGKLNVPPVWLVGFIALAWVISWIWSPLGEFFDWIGWVLVAAGVAVCVWAAVVFRKAGTTIVPGEAPSALVSGGPFRYSRNPIYLGDLVILAGVALILGSPLALLLVIPFQQVLLRLFVLPEEAVLTRDLGQPYRYFMAQVPRWI